MHRSGTSVLTRVINLLGADIPGKVLGKAKDNPTGFWEPSEVVQIDDCMLAYANKSWDSLNVDIEVSPFIVEASDFLEKNKSDLMVIKDPRMCRLARPWRQACINAEIDPVYVIIKRDEEAISQSLLKRNNIPIEQGESLAIEHFIRSTLDTNKCVRMLVEYETLIKMPVVVAMRLYEFLGIDVSRDALELIEDFVDPMMNHVDLPDISAA